MRHYKILLAIILIGVALDSCKKKKEQESPIPSLPVTTGTVSGVVSPIGSAFVVSAISPISEAIVNPNSEGEFIFSDLAVGPYSIKAYPISGYGQPSAIMVDVEANGNYDVGTIVMPIDESGNIFTFALDGTEYEITGSYLDCNFGSPALTIFSSTGDLNSEHYTLNIALDNVNGPASYIVGSSWTSHVRLLQYSSTELQYAWSTLMGGSGTVTITELDEIGHRISGYFTADLVAENGLTTGTKIVAGNFTNLYYE